jgi:large subunit ribosomal protein L13
MKNINRVSQSEIKEKWYLVDASGLRVGLLASKVAELLQGKNDVLKRDYHKPMYKVVVINADKIDFTAKKGMTKFYKSYSGFPGGLKFESLEELVAKGSDRPIMNAVKGMLPATSRGDEMLANLKVFRNADHPHAAQTPTVINIRDLKL